MDLFGWARRRGARSQFRRRAIARQLESVEELRHIVTEDMEELSEMQRRHVKEIREIDTRAEEIISLHHRTNAATAEIREIPEFSHKADLRLDVSSLITHDYVFTDMKGRFSLSHLPHEVMKELDTFETEVREGRYLPIIGDFSFEQRVRTILRRKFMETLRNTRRITNSPPTGIRAFMQDIITKCGSIIKTLGTSSSVSKGRATELAEKLSGFIRELQAILRELDAHYSRIKDITDHMERDFPPRDSRHVELLSKVKVLMAELEAEADKNL